MAKLYQVVDGDDKIIGYKQREDIDYARDIYRIGALWLTNSKGQILIAQRKLNKDKDPGKWGPAAAGTLEKGETYKSNIYKEAEEEIGLSGVKFKLGPKQYFHSPRAAHCQWFLATIDKKQDEFKLQEDEVERIDWVSREWLEEDLIKSPDKYVPSMPDILKLLHD